ncbi:MAG TPA: CbtA family protein [Frankiaceae bacterium]|nr:CbtA family protein [Frankiaceae bacterium]
MEIRIVLRGALSGFLAGVLGFVFARIFAETWINKAIAYESGRDDAIKAVAKAAGVAITPDGPEYFSRTVQSTWGLATGIIGFSTAMGALVAVVYLVLHGRFNIRPRTLVLFIAGLGFLGVYLVPLCKYPPNPPSIGHTFTISTRTSLYLTMVGCSILFLILAAVLGRRLKPRFGNFNATLIAAVAFIAAISIVMGLLPSLGHLAANRRVASSIGYGPSATETPLPVVNPRGQIVYPGFPADVLWKFRFFSILAQMLVWAAIGIIFGGLVERFFHPKARRPVAPDARPSQEPVGV